MPFTCAIIYRFATVIMTHTHLLPSCLIKKLYCVNFQLQFHERIAHTLIYMTHEPCYMYILLLALTGDLITANRQSIQRDTRTAFSLPPVIVSLHIAYWSCIFRWTCSPNINTKQILGQVWHCHVYAASNFRKQQWRPQGRSQATHVGSTWSHRPVTNQHVRARRGAIEPWRACAKGSQKAARVSRSTFTFF